MKNEEAIYTLERLAHTEAKWPGTEEILEALDMAVSALRTAPTLLPGDEPLTQVDLDKMDFDKVWISYGSEPDNGEEALVYHGRIYCIDTLEGAGFEDMLLDLMDGDNLDNPTGSYTVRRCC